MAEIPPGAHWVRFTRFFGDAMMFHAAVAPLRAADLPLVAWGPEWVLDLFTGSPDYVACVPDPPRKPGILDGARLLRVHRPASVISFPKSLRAPAAAFLARVPLRLGCSDGGGRLFCTHHKPFYTRDDAFVARYASVVAQAFPELPTGPFRPFQVRSAMVDQVQSERVALGLGDYVVLAPGGNSDSKRIPLGHLARLAERLKGRGLASVILGGGAHDQQAADGLRALFPEAVDLTAKGGLAWSAAWLQGARAVVGGDSGLSHVAAGMGLPTLAVFGPTRPRHSAPWGPRVVVHVKAGVPCLECMAWSCPLPDHPCMMGLDVDALWDALERLIS